MLNKNGIIPLYIQLQNIIRDDILSGKYKQEELIPSENVLSEQYQITRSTVRKAISNLVDNGLLRREHGKGSFVALQKIKYSMWNFGGFTDFLKKQGKIPYSEVIEDEVLKIGGRSYYRMMRARGLKEEHVKLLTLDTSVLPLDLFPDLNSFDFSKNSLYRTLREEYGIFPDRVEVVVSTERCTELTRKLFKMKDDDSLLKVEGTVLSKKGLEIERMSVVYSPDVDFKLITTLE